MRRLSISTTLAGLIAALTAALGACDKDTFDHESSRQSTSGTATYPNCLAEIYDYYPGPRLCESGLKGQGGECPSCLCYESCQSDEDCAPPAEVGVPGRCIEGECVLDCTDGPSCPEGMACITTTIPTAGSGEICPDGRPCTPDIEMDICMWTLDDPLVCYGGGSAGSSTDPCAEFSDRYACESMTSTNPDLRCAWVEEQILATGNETCEPADVRTRCIALERRSLCEAAACGPEGPSAYWTDLGAGTASLLVLDDCEWRPMPGHEQREACDFSGSVGLPLICDCACTGESAPL